MLTKILRNAITVIYIHYDSCMYINCNAHRNYSKFFLTDCNHLQLTGKKSVITMRTKRPNNVTQSYGYRTKNFKFLQTCKSHTIHVCI